jgi:membrane-associated phospholipid phosphatase
MMFMFRTLACVLLLCAALQAQLPATASASSSTSVNPVIEWNRTLLVIVRTSGAQPATIHSTRNLAMLHAAVYDAVNNISRTYSPYLFRLANVPPNTSQTAAADQAAHDVLVSLYPSFQPTLDAELQQDLARIPHTKSKTDGITVGQTIAADLLAFRSNDGANVPAPVYTSKKVAGYYQLTPPDFTPADFTQWAGVTPFAIAIANEFLPAPPPALTSPEYLNGLAEVERIGEFDSTARTPEQSLIGLFWSGKIQNYWNEIAQTAVLARNLDTPQTARLFALLNISLADTTISFFDAKYAYHFWRPVTAIESSDDRDWLPLTTKSAPDPSYPGAHSATSAAGATVLQFIFGDKFTFDVTSEVMSGVTRHFTSFSAAAEEAGLSRIYAGQHFRFDHNAGLRQGRQVSQSVTQTILLPQ